jgi:hypothetical protein
MTQPATLVQLATDRSLHATVGVPVHPVAPHAQPFCAPQSFADPYDSHAVGIPWHVLDDESHAQPCCPPHDTTSPRYEHGVGDPLHADCVWHPGIASQAEPLSDAHGFGEPEQRVPPSEGAAPSSPAEPSAPASLLDVEDDEHALASHATATARAARLDHEYRRDPRISTRR